MGATVISEAMDGDQLAEPNYVGGGPGGEDPRPIARDAGRRREAPEVFEASQIEAVVVDPDQVPGWPGLDDRIREVDRCRAPAAAGARDRGRDVARGWSIWWPS